MHNKKTDPLTRREGQLFHYLVEYFADHGKQPSIETIMLAIGCETPKYPIYLLKQLRLKGYIAGAGDFVEIVGRLQGTEPPETHERLIQVPLLRREIPLNRDDPEDVFWVPLEMTKTPSTAFIVEVTEDNLTSANLLKGDLVVMQPAKLIYCSGTPVLCRLADQVLIRRLYKYRFRRNIRTDDEVLPLKFRKDFEVYGEMVGVLRRY